MFHVKTRLLGSLSKPPIQKHAGLWPPEVYRFTTSICLSKPAKNLIQNHYSKHRSVVRQAMVQGGLISIVKSCLEHAVLSSWASQGGCVVGASKIR